MDKTIFEIVKETEDNVFKVDLFLSKQKRHLKTILELAEKLRLNLPEIKLESAPVKKVLGGAISFVAALDEEEEQLQLMALNANNEFVDPYEYEYDVIVLLYSEIDNCIKIWAKYINDSIKNSTVLDLIKTCEEK